MIRFRTLLHVLVTAVLLVIVTAVILEIGLRAAGIQPPLLEYGHAKLGIIPAASGRWSAHAPDGGPPYISRTNRQTFFENKDVPPEKPAGVYRIGIVGDSHTACECANESSYPNRLEQRLHASGFNRRSFDVINAGVGKYSPYQYYLRARDQVLPLHPDHLIVGYYLGNDLLDLIRQDDRPYLALNANGEFEAHPPSFLVYGDPAKLGEKSILGFSRLYNVLANGGGYHLSRARMLLHNISGAGYGMKDALSYMSRIASVSKHGVNYASQIVHQQVWFDHFPATQPTAEKINREVMRLTRDMCASRGIKLTFVLLPTKADIEPEDMAEVAKAVEKERPTLSLENVRQFHRNLAARIKEQGRELNVEVLDLTGPLLARRGPEPMYFPSDMHLNSRGNQIVAEVLAEKLFNTPPVHTNVSGISVRALASR